MFGGERSGGLRLIRMGSPRARGIGLTLAALLAALAGFAVPHLPQDWQLKVLSPGWMPHQAVQLLEYSNDIQVAMLAERPDAPHPRIALVLVTDETLAGLPYVSPIDRGLIARLVKAVDGLGASVVGLDLIFDQSTEPGKDQALAEALRFARATVVLGGADERTPLTPRRRSWQTRFLEDSRAPFGYFNLRYDVREAALTHVIRNRAAPHPGSHFERSFAEAVALSAGVRSLPSSRRIPWLRAAASGSDIFLTLDAETVLAAERDPDSPLSRAIEDQVHGRIVLVGADLERRDRHPTPLSLVAGEDMLGVAVHAQILAGILDGRTLTESGVVVTSTLSAAAALLGALIGWFAARRRLVLTLLIASGTLVIMAASAIVLWQLRAIVPIAALVAAFVGAVMIARFTRGWMER